MSSSNENTNRTQEGQVPTTSSQVKRRSNQASNAESKAKVARIDPKADRVVDDATRSYPCIVEGCSWTGPIDEIEAHFHEQENKQVADKRLVHRMVHQTFYTTESCDPIRATSGVELKLKTPYIPAWELSYTPGLGAFGFLAKLSNDLEMVVLDIKYLNYLNYHDMKDSKGELYLLMVNSTGGCSEPRYEITVQMEEEKYRYCNYTKVARVRLPVENFGGVGNFSVFITTVDRKVKRESRLDL